MMTTPYPIEIGYAEIVARELPTIAALCRRYRVRRLDLFGSAVGERFDAKRSDIDLLVEFEPMPPGAYADAYFGLRGALEILFSRSVDLVTEPALKNPYLRERIASEAITLYPAR